MATAQEQPYVPHVGNDHNSIEKQTHAYDYAPQVVLSKQRVPYDYGGNPLAHVNTNDPERQLRPFGGEFQPGLYKQNRKFGNPAPLGLSAFALTTFVLSLINVHAKNIAEPSIVIAIAFAYGGLVQLLAGMWELAVGNTFGATSLSSFGGFWLSFAIILTPGFDIASGLSANKDPSPFLNSFGLYLMGWFIFTFILLLCTLRSTVAFFLLFFTLDITFLLLAIGYLKNDGQKPHDKIIVVAGSFGLAAAFIAWYNALAGLADSSNSFFVIPVAHFPWSDKGREGRTKVDNEEAREHQA